MNKNSIGAWNAGLLGSVNDRGLILENDTQDNTVPRHCKTVYRGLKNLRIQQLQIINVELTPFQPPLASSGVWVWHQKTHISG